MTRILVKRQTALSPQAIWRSISDLAAHPKWMRDAKWIVFVGDQTRGVGTRMRVRTVVGPLRLIDEMEVVGWDEGSFIEVEHRGVVKGTGRLSVDQSGAITWEETLRFPWWLGGALGAGMARPILRRLWAGNLRRLEETVSFP